MESLTHLKLEYAQQVFICAGLPLDRLIFYLTSDRLFVVIEYMAHTLNIRRARINDARAYSKMTRALIETGLPPSWETCRVIRLLSQEDTNAYSLVSGRQLAGFNIASFGSQRMHLVLHAIAPEFRRRGMGRQLLTWQLQAAMAAGLTECTLEVRAQNVVARSFYEALGFNVIERLPGYYSQIEDALRMTLSPLRSYAAGE